MKRDRAENIDIEQNIEFSVSLLSIRFLNDFQFSSQAVDRLRFSDWVVSIQVSEKCQLRLTPLSQKAAV